MLGSKHVSAGRNLFSARTAEPLAKICKPNSRRRPRATSIGNHAGQPAPIFTGSALICRFWFQLEGLAVAIPWGFESPLPHQTSLRSVCCLWASSVTRPSRCALGHRERVPPSAPDFARLTRERASSGKPARELTHRPSLSAVAATPRRRTLQPTTFSEQFSTRRLSTVARPARMWTGLRSSQVPPSAPDFARLHGASFVWQASERAHPPAKSVPPVAAKPRRRTSLASQSAQPHANDGGLMLAWHNSVSRCRSKWRRRTPHKNCNPHSRKRRRAIRTHMTRDSRPDCAGPALIDHPGCGASTLAGCVRFRITTVLERHSSVAVPFRRRSSGPEK